MKISIVSVWCNEELFAPFFFAHYDYIDEIHIFLDAYTNDKTREICEQHSKVEVEEFAFPNNIFDEKTKMRKINNFIAESKSDWIYVIDADDFIFPANGESARVVLVRQTAKLLYTQLWQSWRHKTEATLNPSKPSILQRRHGYIYDRRGRQRLLNIPCISKPEIGIWYKRGPHTYCKNKKLMISEERFVGAHWQSADVDRAIAKKIEKLERSGIKQKINCSSIKKQMMAAARAHLNDPQMF